MSHPPYLKCHTHLIYDVSADSWPAHVLDEEGDSVRVWGIGGKIEHALLEPGLVHGTLVTGPLSDCRGAHDHTQPVFRQLQVEEGEKVMGNEQCFDLQMYWVGSIPLPLVIREQ